MKLAVRSFIVVWCIVMVFEERFGLIVAVWKLSRG